MREHTVTERAVPLLGKVLWRILPISILVLVGVWILVIQASERSLTKETTSRIDQTAAGLAMITESRLANILSIVRSLAANSLMVNALIDQEIEDHAYMETFFRSLQIAGLSEASINLLDYKGRTVIGAGEQHLNAEEVESLMRGDELLEIDPESQIFHFATPVNYHGRAEGILLLHLQRSVLMEALGKHLPAEANLLRTDGGQVLYSGLWGGDDDLGFVISADPSMVEAREQLALLPGITVHYAEERQQAFETLEQLHQVLLLVLLLDLVALVAGIVMAGRAVVSPVKQFTQQLEVLSRQGGDQVVAERGSAKEINLLVHTFNHLQELNQGLSRDLRRQYEDMEHIFTSMAEPLLVLNAGVVVQVNPSAEALFGYEGELLIGRPISELIDERGDGNKDKHEIEALAVGGEKIPVLRSISGLHSSPERSVWVLHDLRERLKIEQQEQYASFQAGIVEMGASVLHNVGNAVTGMTGDVHGIEQEVRLMKRIAPLLTEQGEQCKQLAQSLPEESEVVGKIDQHGEVFVRGGKLLEKIVSEAGVGGYLMKLQRAIQHTGEVISIQQSAAKPMIHASHFVLESVVTDTLSLLQNSLDKYRIEVEVQLDSDVTGLYLPRNPLIQLLLNLVKNSVESIGEVMMRQHDYAGRIVISSRRIDDQWFELMVADNGEGVPAEHRDQLFRSGYSSKERGSGFGLHSAANFVGSLGGEIAFQNDETVQGAVLRIELPMVMKEEHE